MDISDRIPLVLGRVKFLVKDGKGFVVSTFESKNASAVRLQKGLARVMGSANTTAGLRCTAIDFYSAESAFYHTGSSISIGAGGDWAETYVTHTASYTAAATKTITKVRLRDEWIAFDTSSVSHISQVTGLSVGLQTSWSVEAQWTLRFL